MRVENRTMLRARGLQVLGGGTFRFVQMGAR